MTADPQAQQGQLSLRAELEELLLVAIGAAPGALLLVDQAYAEFAGEDLTSAALALENAAVLR